MNATDSRLHVYTGDGKGKTSAAVGLAIRALGAGMKVAFLQFDKGYDGGEDIYNERKVLRTFENIYLFSTGLSRMNADGSFRFGTTDGDIIEAKIALEKAASLIKDTRYSMVILDEIVTSVEYGQITKADVMKIIEYWRGLGKPCELVMTGRGAWDELIDAADLVSEIRNIKHYFDAGSPAKKGVEY